MAISIPIHLTALTEGLTVSLFEKTSNKSQFLFKELINEGEFVKLSTASVADKPSGCA